MDHVDWDMDFEDVFNHFLSLRVNEEGIFEAELLLESENVSTSFFILVVIERVEFVV